MTALYAVSETTVVVLDTGVRSLLAQRPGVKEADNCREWLAACVRKGATIRVPAIANHETRRKLSRARKKASIQRLDSFLMAVPGRYVTLTDVDLHLAAELWAQSRQQGLPTSDPKELDGDVIVAAQALNTGYPPSSLVVATTNVRHLARFLDARLWTEIIILPYEA